MRQMADEGEVEARRSWGVRLLREADGAGTLLGSANRSPMAEVGVKSLHRPISVTHNQKSTAVFMSFGFLPFFANSFAEPMHLSSSARVYIRRNVDDVLTFQGAAFPRR